MLGVELPAHAHTNFTGDTDFGAESRPGELDIAVPLTGSGHILTNVLPYLTGLPPAAPGLHSGGPGLSRRHVELRYPLLLSRKHV
ncbi:MAG: hypothetical protein ACXVXP_06015, partial [Mycobacteriaceae bacterium]